ncbi:MAG: L-threonine 3-dehydrogenase, partial [Solirubrobacteraceae bacterium]
MKALVKERPEAGLWLRDVEMPAVGSDDVLIRVIATGICGTDLHIHAWDEWAARTVPT